MSKPKSRQYDNEFKTNTLNLYQEGSRSLTQLSQDLGIPVRTLRGWVACHGKTVRGPVAPGKSAKQPPYAEMLVLRKELAIIREERDILKKALGIFSLPSK